jgi:translation initiation factor IF-2
VAEKMRVHILAKQLNVSSKAILAKCAAEGLPVKNHMTALSAGLDATIREWFTEGQHSTTLETAERVNLEKVRVKRKKKPAAETAAAAEAPPQEEAVAQATAVAEAPPAEPEAPPIEEAPAEAPAPAVEELPTEAPAPDVEEIPTEPAAAPTEAPVHEPIPAAEPEVSEEAPPELGTAPPPEVEEADERMVAQVETAGVGEVAPPEAPPEQPTPEPVLPAGPQNVPAPARLKGPRVVRYEAPDHDYFPPRRRPGEAAEPPVGPPPDRLIAPEVAPDRRRGVGEARRRGQGTTASPRRAAGRGSEIRSMEKLKEWRDQDLLERKERLAGATGRRIHTRRAIESQAGAAQAPPVMRKTKAEVHEPIRIREFCATVGVPFLRLMRTLQRDHDMAVVNISTTLPTELAELIALEEGIELEVIPSKSRLDLLREEFEQRAPKKLGPRPPVVTFLGHVDHGKTTLLDAIRRTRVVAGEDGGITQHIGSYHFQRDSVAVTFLDTPGHAAFTAIRARGAQLTDLVVLILAADDGVMPQTVEAINHAKAAEVPIVVAITKIDLGNFDENRVYAQLAEHELTPSGTWGGHTDVIKTSAVTGEGIDQLVEHLAAMTELMELEADHTGDPRGAVIEAEVREGVGPVARVLVQSGRLRPGMTIVCGNAFGKVRAILDDQGKRLSEAGPSIPCEIWGLDEVPSAGDPFYGLKSSQQAKAIAEETRAERLAQSRTPSQKAQTLEEVFKQRDAEGVPELEVIIRADVDGSVDALRQALNKLPTEQVHLVIRHAGVGAVTDSDVVLAHASGAVIIAFRVAIGANTQKLAEEHGVDVREYKVIYDVVDDIVKALEGLLAPEERRETRGTAEVRDVFKISKVGTVAGCYVTDGVIAREHQVRLVREGVVVRDDCRIDSLRRFKDDVKEVRAGMECGLHVERFNDVKQGDVVEAYEIVHIARTL